MPSLPCFPQHLSLGLYPCCCIHNSLLTKRGRTGGTCSCSLCSSNGELMCHYKYQQNVAPSFSPQLSHTDIHRHENNNQHTCQLVHLTCFLCPYTWPQSARYILNLSPSVSEKTTKRQIPAARRTGCFGMLLHVCCLPTLLSYRREKSPRCYPGVRSPQKLSPATQRHEDCKGPLW